tara:strand:+ start:679 stop:987 length:309 start_codon:yes stop_codon:yes gene_type:complete
VIDDYELLIEDYKPSRKEIIKKLNEAIKSDRPATKTAKGLEIEVPDSWVDVLQNDAAILYDYGKVGWKVMWYQIHTEGPGEGDLVRSWISIKDKRHIAKEMR